MQLINREEFADILGVTIEWTYKINNFPEPCEKIKRGGAYIPMWRLEIAEEYAKTRERLNYRLVKQLNDLGVTRKNMAEILETTVAKLGCYCRYHKIVSLSTIKDIKARKAHNLKMQTEFWPSPVSKTVFGSYLDRHVKLTPSAEVPE